MAPAGVKLVYDCFLPLTRLQQHKLWAHTVHLLLVPAAKGLRHACHNCCILHAEQHPLQLYLGHSRPNCGPGDRPLVNCCGQRHRGRRLAAVITPATCISEAGLQLCNDSLCHTRSVQPTRLLANIMLVVWVGGRVSVVHAKQAWCVERLGGTSTDSAGVWSASCVGGTVSTGIANVQSMP